MSPVAGLLLAAGSGSRLGWPKALLEVGGRLLVEHGVVLLRAGGCDPVVVVLGAAAGEVRVRAALGEAVLIDNPAWRSGIGSSLRAGLAALAGTDASAAVVALVDQPCVGPAAVRRLIAVGGPVAVAGYCGRRGNPVLLGRQVWAEVAALAEGDVGARPFLQAHPELVRLVDCDGTGSPQDVDTPDDLALLKPHPVPIRGWSSRR